MNKTLRRILSVSGILSSVLVIFIVILSNSITNGLDVNSINDVVEYLSIFNSSNGDYGVNVMIVFVKIKQYSHIILTISIICITLFSYMWITPKDD